MQLSGIHHLTAITAKVSRNHAFYTRTLGMRLVKKTVNQDDVSAYHLFYADGLGSPGTDVTFFDWPVPPEQRGNHSIARTGLRLGSEASVAWWARRFEAEGVAHDPPAVRDGRLTMDFEDGEGQRLSFCAEPNPLQPAHPWVKSPVPPEHQIRGLGPITLSVPDLGPTDRVLTTVMNLRSAREFRRADSVAVRVYEMGEGGPAAELQVAVEPSLSVARQGAGGVHHVAFRTTLERLFGLGGAAGKDGYAVERPGRPILF